MITKEEETSYYPSGIEKVYRLSIFDGELGRQEILNASLYDVVRVAPAGTYFSYEQIFVYVRSLCSSFTFLP